MPILTLTNIEKNFGRRVMFDKLEFGIDRGERVGLIGDNGSGKTSLFKVITGELAIDDGNVSIARSVRVGHLVQDPVFDGTNTVLDETELAFSELHDLSHKMRELEHEMAVVQGDDLDKVLKKYEDVQHQFDLAGGYVWHHRLEATLLGVGLARETWEQSVSTLSGGQRSRLALAKLLISQPDVLLLDEPTNHLDLAAIAWLEDYLAEFTGAVLLITHDRYLLDRLATRIVWLTQAKLKSYPGNYSAFVAQREIHELSQKRAYEEQQADIDKQAEFIRRFGAGQRSKEAKGREKRLNRLLQSDSLLQAVDVSKKIRVNLGTDQRAGDRVLTVRELSKSYDAKKLWDGIALDVKRGERVGIIGPNGSGKTTLLEVLIGRRDADAGDVRWGANLNIGYYDQRLADFDPENTVADEIRGDREVSDKDIRAVCALMLFRNEDVEKPMSLLSGGERARVALAQLLIDRPNVLILDEPTNHLDVNSCEALEKALRDFIGTILFVSHDRYFLDKISERLLVIEPPNLLQFAGNYSAWAKKRAADAADAAAIKDSKSKSKNQNKPVTQKAPEQKPQKNFSQNSQHNSPRNSTGKPKKNDNPWSRPFGRLTLEELEKQISQTEFSLTDCQGRFGDPAVTRDSSSKKKLQSEYDEIARKLKQLEQEYFERNA